MDLRALIAEPLPRLLSQIALIILVSRALGLAVRHLRQPMVIAEIVAGILLGPSLFGWLAPDAYSLVFARESLGALALISQLGLVLFMFLVGLELDLGKLRGSARASWAISHVSIIAPFALGLALAFGLREQLSEPGKSFVPFALFMGTSMSITAFPVLARILMERRLLHTKVGVVAITCAAVDDVTAWCILAFVVAIARAKGLHGAGLTVVLAAAHSAFMLGVVRPLLHRLGKYWPASEAVGHDWIAGTALMLFASSWVTELIGIHALFGAFMFGAILPKERKLPQQLAGKFGDLVLVVLLPLFFAYSGVRTQFGLMSSVEDWAVCGVIILAASVGKFGASTLVARLTGLSWRESGALGLLMNTRGLMELIVLNLGLDLGVISPKVFTMMVIMALVTTFATSPLLHRVYPAGFAAREQLRLRRNAPGPVLDPVQSP
jgi:Kef-type K+ transport system membrane component KefB